MKYTLTYRDSGDLIRAVNIEPLENYCLRVSFSNGEVKRFNVLPLINKGGVFAQLKDINKFNGVKIAYDTAVWSFTDREIDDIDICIESLYWDGESINAKKMYA
ncbi:MAG: DUF2442 domain-containing protein [Chitinivibrionia bacterium]|nr:DUF2442 domain-containing protein [Chitinivibrionia bacterium]